MKKILSALIMTALMGTGLVAFTSQPASAACAADRYASPCLNTATSVSAPASKRAPKSVPIRVSVVGVGTTVAPRGTVRVVVTKTTNGKVKFDSTVPYVGGQVQFVTQSLRKGTYAVTATYVSTVANDNRFNDSTASTSFVIKKKRRR